MRRAWECAVLLKLREELRSGNLAVRHSKRFGQLKDYFISDQQWGESRDLFFLRSGLPADPNQVPAYLKDALKQSLRRVSADRAPKQVRDRRRRSLAPFRGPPPSAWPRTPKLNCIA